MVVGRLVDRKRVGGYLRSIRPASAGKQAIEPRSCTILRSDHHCHHRHDHPTRTNVSNSSHCNNDSVDYYIVSCMLMQTNVSFFLSIFRLFVRVRVCFGYHRNLVVRPIFRFGSSSSSAASNSPWTVCASEWFSLFPLTIHLHGGGRGRRRRRCLSKSHIFSTSSSWSWSSNTVRIAEAPDARTHPARVREELLRFPIVAAGNVGEVLEHTAQGDDTLR